MLRNTTSMLHAAPASKAPRTHRLRRGARTIDLLRALAAFLLTSCAVASAEPDGEPQRPTLSSASANSYAELNKATHSWSSHEISLCSAALRDAGAAAVASSRSLRTVVDATAMTGFNDLCGAPIYRLPLPWLQDRHIPMVGAYDMTPGAARARALTTAQCARGERANVLLATVADPVFETAYGLPPPHPDLLNVLLHDVRTGADGGRLIALPAFDAVPPNPEPPTRGAVDAPVDLATWLSAKGRMQVACKEDGSALIRSDFRNLIPNGLYSVIGVWTPPPGGNRHIAVPFGGLPNVFSADGEGHAALDRQLSTCPLGATPEGSVLTFVDVYYQANRSSDQAFMTKLVLADGSEVPRSAPSGTTNMVQLSFPFGVECRLD